MGVALIHPHILERHLHVEDGEVFLSPIAQFACLARFGFEQQLLLQSRFFQFRADTTLHLHGRRRAGRRVAHERSRRARSRSGRGGAHFAHRIGRFAGAVRGVVTIIPDVLELLLLVQD